MEAGMSALQRYQIGNFFRENAQVTQLQCDQEAERVTGGPVKPSPVQGGASYTVVAGDTVVQFRSSHSTLDLELLGCVERTYAGFAPIHSKVGELSGLPIYTMNNVGGVSMYLARDALFRDDYRLLRVTLKDYARFFASAWSNTPRELPAPDRQDLFKDYSQKLSRLADGLPERFRATIDRLILRLPALFEDDWPMVPNHIDLLENNIHVDPNTGALVGICDWKDVVIGPFGMSLSGLETMLGVSTMKGWRWHSDHPALRDLFWGEFYKAVGTKLDDRVEVARLLDILNAHGLTTNEDGVRVPVSNTTTEGTLSLNYLDEVVLGIPGEAVISGN